MKRISFRQFINTFNFRDFNEGNEDNKIIRINFSLLNDDCSSHHYIDFGVYDFDGGKRARVEKVFSSEILDSYIESIGFAYGFENTVEIYLTKDSVEE